MSKLNIIRKQIKILNKSYDQLESMFHDKIEIINLRADERKENMLDEIYLIQKKAKMKFISDKMLTIERQKIEFPFLVEKLNMLSKEENATLLWSKHMRVIIRKVAFLLE